MLFSYVVIARCVLFLGKSIQIHQNAIDIQTIQIDVGDIIIVLSCAFRAYVRRRPWHSQKTSRTSSVSCQARRSDSKPMGLSSSTTSGAAGRRSWGLTCANLSNAGQRILYHSGGRCQTSGLAQPYRLCRRNLHGLQVGHLSTVGSRSLFVISCVVFSDRPVTQGVGALVVVSL